MEASLPPHLQLPLRRAEVVALLLHEAARASNDSQAQRHTA